MILIRELGFSIDKHSHRVLSLYGWPRISFRLFIETTCSFYFNIINSSFVDVNTRRLSHCLSVKLNLSFILQMRTLDPWATLGSIAIVFGDVTWSIECVWGVRPEIEVRSIFTSLRLSPSSVIIKNPFLIYQRNVSRLSGMARYFSLEAFVLKFVFIIGLRRSD